MKNVFKTELKGLLSGKRAYIYSALSLMLSAFFIVRYNLAGALPNLEYSLEIMTLPMLFLLPILCSDVFSGKQTRGFDSMLLSLGVPETSLLFGKLLARLTVFAPTYLILMAVPPFFSIFGKVNIPEAYAGLLGYLLFCLSAMSIFFFVSAVTRSALASTVICYASAIATYCFELLYTYLPRSVNVSFVTLTAVLIGLVLILYMMTGSETFSAMFALALEAVLIIIRIASPTAMEKALATVLKVLSPRSSLTGFFYGLLDIGEILYLLCFISVFTLAALISLEKRRYNGKEI